MRLGIFRLLLPLLIILFPGPSFGEPGLRQDFQNWDVVTLTLPVTPGKKVLWYGEVQPRIGNLDDRGTSNDFSQLILRTALGYQLTRKVSVWQGYAWVPTFEPVNLNEHRIFQQLTINGKLRRLDVSNRTRLEQRWIENTGQTSIRFRHMARGMLPLDRQRKWALVLYDEFFVTLKGVPNGPAAGFDQNRLFVGVNRKLNEVVNAEAGYLNQFVNSRDPVANRMNHVLLLTVNFQVR